MLVASIAIVQTELIAGLDIVPMAAMLGLASGAALAKSKFKDGTAHFFQGAFITVVIRRNQFAQPIQSRIVGLQFE